MVFGLSLLFLDYATKTVHQVKHTHSHAYPRDCDHMFASRIVRRAVSTEYGDRSQIKRHPKQMPHHTCMFTFAEVRVCLYVSVCAVIRKQKKQSPC